MDKKRDTAQAAKTKASNPRVASIDDNLPQSISHLADSGGAHD